jgi:hypothetical protein
MALSLCSTSVDNTGELACDKSKGVLRKMLIFNGAIASGDYASADLLAAKLIANAKLSKDDSNKIFPISEVQNLERNSEANVTGTLNLGFTTVIREGRPAYTGKIFGGADLLKRLRTFNNQTVRVLEYDANGIVWGTKSGTTFVGYQAKLFFSGGEIATGQNVEEGVIDVQVSILSNSEYKDNSYWAEMPTGFNVDDIAPLIDVPLSFISNVANVFKIGIKIPGSNIVEPYNIYDDYGTAIAALTFTAGTGTNYGTPLTITSVAVDASLKCLTVTFDSTAYTALADATLIKLTPPTQSALDAANVTGIELLPVILTEAA